MNIKLIATLIELPAFAGFSYLVSFVGMIIGTTVKMMWKERIEEKYFIFYCIAAIISVIFIVLYVYLITKG